MTTWSSAKRPGVIERGQAADAHRPAEVVGGGSLGARLELREPAEIDREHEDERRRDDGGDRRERPTDKPSGPAPDPSPEGTGRDLYRGR